ncbi:MAG: MATE family efflux transporter, partial [Rikenellaceae bacterium]
FAYSAESLAGKYYGAGNGLMLQKCVRVVNRFGIASALLFTVIYLVALYPILSIFTDDTAALELAMHYRWWVAAIPLAGYLAFVYDGISGGMTKTVIMRDTIFVSMVLFFVCYYFLSPLFGNDALWFSLILFLLGRGVFQAFFINRIVHKK